jgi:multimeric flavodoxin WrbA
MKVVAFNGSARKDGNTAALVRAVFEPLGAAGVQCELVQLAGKRVHGCTACMKCAEDRSGRCTGLNDFANDCIELMIEADGVIIASPVYFADVSTETKALIDRAGYATRQAVDPLLRRKVGAAVVAARRAGAIHAFDTINHFFLIAEMIVPGSTYWNVGIGRAPGEVEGDAEGMRTMRALGENMAWLLERTAG